jgi:hypothetical protein
LRARKPHRGTSAQTHAHDPIAKAVQEIDVRRDALAGTVQIDDRLARAQRPVVPVPFRWRRRWRRRRGSKQHRVRLARQRRVPQEELGRGAEQRAQEGRERRRRVACAAKEHHLVDPGIGEEGAHACAQGRVCEIGG